MKSVRISLPDRSGTVRGAIDNSIMHFLGIPFAKPPVGPNRFRRPQMPVPWDGDLDATRYGAWAPQAPDIPGVPRIPVAMDVKIGDDFLNLNVWTPDVGANLPVMVFIHGGSFTTGSGAMPTYNGESFARNGVVLVTINYRLGVEGFLWTGEGTPNLGLLDQIAALEWVQRNISAFGGDRANLTIFGESAGAMSVVTLMTMPRAKGLFRRAIAQSGAGDNIHSERTARMISRRLAKMLGVTPTLAGIASAPPAAVSAATAQLESAVSRFPVRARWGDASRTLLPFSPVVDGTTVVDSPRVLIAEGAAGEIDLLIGTNSEEARLFFVPDGSIDKMSALVFALFARNFGARLWDSYRYYRGKGVEGTGARCAALLTDGFYRVPALRVAESHSKSYLYLFDWGPKTYEGRLGPCHTMELPFVFNNLSAADMESVRGPGAPEELAHSMHRAWIRFADTGNPGWGSYAATEECMVYSEEGGSCRRDASVDRRIWKAPEVKPRLKLNRTQLP